MSSAKATSPMGAEAKPASGPDPYERWDRWHFDRFMGTSRGAARELRVISSHGPEAENE